jgi:hypothetical protein
VIPSHDRYQPHCRHRNKSSGGHCVDDFSSDAAIVVVYSNISGKVMNNNIIPILNNP